MDVEETFYILLYVIILYFIYLIFYIRFIVFDKGALKILHSTNASEDDELMMTALDVLGCIKKRHIGRKGLNR